MTKETETTKPAEQRCPHCGYTKMDATWYGDHWRCKGREDAPWEKEARAAYAKA